MSDNFYLSSKSSSTINLPQINLSLSEGRVQYGNHPYRIPIEWSPEIQGSLLSFFTKIDYPFRRHVNLPFSEDLNGEVRRFLISLDAYIESPNPVIPYRDILYGVTKKGYAKILKRIKRKAFINQFGTCCEKPEWWDETPSYQISDIGDIFNYQFVIFFKEDDEEDYKISLLETNIQEEHINEFKRHLRELLPDESEVEEVDSNTILLEESGSAAFDVKKQKTCPHYMIKNKFLDFSNRRKLCKRTVVPLGPENQRDTILLCPSDLNRIKLIDKQTMNILSRLDGHIHLRDENRIIRRIRKFSKNAKHFIQRDLKKEGLTKPKELLKAMLEVLHETYTFKAFECPKFYDNFEILVKNEIFKMKRGHGLGMANTLTTLMQLVIHEMTLERCINNDLLFNKVDLLVLNDDYVSSFEKRVDLESYWNQEFTVMRDLSLLRENSKSFFSKNAFVIAERYFPFELNDKISFKNRECLLSLNAMNIFHAKEIFRNAQTVCDDKIVERYIGEIISFWGYEFCPDEIEYPAICGGWIDNKLSSVSLGLKTLENIKDYKTKIYGAFKAESLSLNTTAKSGKNHQAIVFKVYGNIPIDKEFNHIFNILDESVVKDKFTRISQLSVDKIKKYYQRIEHKRKKAYEKYRHTQIPFNKLIDEIVETYPNKIFYPLDFMIKGFCECEIWRTDLIDYYSSSDPIGDYLRTKLGLNPFPNEFSLNFIKRDTHYMRSGKHIQDMQKRIFKVRDEELLGTSDPLGIQFPIQDNLEFEESYLNPVAIASMNRLMDFSRGLPILKEKYRSPLINSKKAIYGIILGMRQVRELTELSVSPKLLKDLFLVIRRENISLDNLISILKEIDKEGLETNKDNKNLIVNPMGNREGSSSPKGEIDPLSLTMSSFLEDPTYWFFAYRDGSCDFLDEELKILIERVLEVFILINTRAQTMQVQHKHESMSDIISHYRQLLDEECLIIWEILKLEKFLGSAIDIFEDDDSGIGLFGDEEEEW